MSTTIEPWSSFFKAAGIPSVSAKNYGSIFDDNRITKDMLLDLDKEILREMGISIMGDVIAILKHAKKVYNEELKKKNSVTNSGKSSAKVVPIAHCPPVSKDKLSQVLPTAEVTEEPMSIAPTISPKSAPKDPHKLDTISADVQYTTAAYKNQLSVKTTSVEMTAIPPYGSSLHSDKIVSPSATTRSLEKPLILEEYTTSTYEERMKKKRPVSVVRTVAAPVTSPIKPVCRIIVIPSSQEKKPHLSSSGERSKRFLEAAGIIETSGHSDPIVLQSPKHSIFSRLELPAHRISPATSIKTPSASIKERLGHRVNSPPETNRTGHVTLYSELGEEQRERGSIRDRLGSKDTTISISPPPPSEHTMVADSVSRHSDVHARLKKQGVSFPVRSRGPLGKRLGQHAVFDRLE